jgi:hypothetical protein
MSKNLSGNRVRKYKIILGKIMTKTNQMSKRELKLLSDKKRNEAYQQHRIKESHKEFHDDAELEYINSYFKGMQGIQVYREN